MTRDPTFWILARASGLTAYVVVTLAVLSGLVLKSRPLGGRLRAAAVADTHRSLAFLGLAFVAVHGLTLVLDSTVSITPLALLVPGLTGYRPLATALGIVAAELIVLIYASFSFRKRLGTRNWRRLHWATYGVFGLATVHGLAAGTDSPHAWVLALYLGAVGAVVSAATWRFMAPRIPKGVTT